MIEGHVADVRAELEMDQIRSIVLLVAKLVVVVVFALRLLGAPRLRFFEADEVHDRLDAQTGVARGTS